MKLEDQPSLPVSSTHPPDFAPEQVALYRDVLTLLNGQNIPYVVSGAFAFQQHTGIWRDTKDLDLFLCPADASAALSYLGEQGFDCEIRDPIWLAKVHRNDYFVDFITGMSNGILRVERNWIERALPCNLFDVPTRVLAAEELLASKLFVLFRERFDGADMVHLIYASQNRLDWQRILQLAGEHRGLLFAVLLLYRYVYPHAAKQVPSGVWQLLAQEFQDGLKDSQKEPSFRGTLLDENMFAVDVKEWGLPDLLRDSRSRKLDLIQELKSEVMGISR